MLSKFFVVLLYGASPDPSKRLLHVLDKRQGRPVCGWVPPWDLGCRAAASSQETTVEEVDRYLRGAHETGARFGGNGGPCVVCEASWRSMTVQASLLDGLVAS